MASKPTSSPRTKKSLVRRGYWTAKVALRDHAASTNWLPLYRVKAEAEHYYGAKDLVRGYLESPI